MYLASLSKKKRKERCPELVHTKSSIPIRDETDDEEHIEQIQLDPTEQIDFKIEPDLPLQSVEGGVSKRLQREAVVKVLPVRLQEIKSEPGLVDQIAGGFLTQNGKPVQIVDFQEFEKMLAKVKAEKSN